MMIRKKRVFISYDYTRDRNLKGTFVGQANCLDLPVLLEDFSLEEDHQDPNWQRKARDQIRKCDLVIVLLGQDTHNAAGVRKEVDIARGFRKPVFQIRPRKSPHGEVLGAGAVYAWRWKTLVQLLS